MDRKVSSVIPDEFLEPEGVQPIWNALKEMVNFSLLTNPIFLLVGTSNIFGMLGFYVPFVYLPNMATLRGISVEDANFLLSIIGKHTIYTMKKNTICLPFLYYCIIVLSQTYNSYFFSFSKNTRYFKHYWSSDSRMDIRFFLCKCFISHKSSHIL